MLMMYINYIFYIYDLLYTSIYMIYYVRHKSSFLLKQAIEPGYVSMHNNIVLYVNLLRVLTQCIAVAYMHCADCAYS